MPRNKKFHAPAIKMPMSPSSERYERLSKKETHNPEDSPDASSTPSFPLLRNFQRFSCYRIFMGIALALLLFLSLVQLALMTTHSTRLRITEPESINESPCGVTVEEAKAKGCQYSIALGDWLHHDCYDQQLEDEYRAQAAEFEWYYPNAANTGPDLSRRLGGWDDLAARGFPLITWTTWQFHVDHCLYSWKYMHKLVSQGREVSAGLTDLDHTHHCAMEVADRNFGMKDVVTGHINGFPPCVELKGYKKTHRYPYEINGTGYG